MNDENHQKFMKRALTIAKKGLDQGELPVGALIVQNNEIIAEAYAQDRTQQRRLVHAELLVLDIVDKLQPSHAERRTMSLFTTLEPCIMCLGAAMAFGIGNIYYALESPLDGACKLVNRYFEREEYGLGYSIPEIRSGILREQSIALFKQYLEMNVENGINKWTKLLLETIK